MELKSTLLAASILIFSAVSAQNIGQVQAPSGSSLEFIPNKGQIADSTGKVRKDILYISHSGPVEIYLRTKGLSYVISTLRNPKLNPGHVDDDPPGAEITDSHDHKLKLRDEPFKTCRVDMDFVGASIPTTQNIAPTEGYLNFYYAHCPQGITHVKAYENILYKDIYPGVDVSYKGSFDKGLKYDIIVGAGANPDKIRMKYTGTENIEIKDGRLLLTAFTGKMEERIPKIYQNIDGKEVSVEGQYFLYHKGKDSAEGTIVGIKVKKYNKAYPLVIDPWWATYCGGSGDDEAYVCALDGLGNTLVSGTATSANFPVSVGAFQTSLVGTMDVFVIKFNTNGQRLWATYYGGSNSEGGYGITSDQNNNVFVTGNTNSTNFPVSGGAFQSSLGGGIDGFLIKFDPNGNRLWGTYCGGSSKDLGNAVITDNAGNVAIAGYTLSSNFPVSVTAFQTSYAGGAQYGDAFIMKFDPNGNQLWGTYFGGTSDDGAFGICADANGNIGFTGLTSSSNLPISTGCFQSTPGSSFVGEFDPNGVQLWATYFGGIGNGCAIDKSNNVVIAGCTGGGYPYYSFPTTPIIATPGVYETSLTTGLGFAAKFSPTGGRVWATFNNTNISEGGDYAMTVDEANNVYLEDDEEPPSFIGPSCAFQRHYRNTQECVYIVKLDSNAKYSCSTYTCGTIYDEHEYTSANLAARNGRMAIAGYTSGGMPTTPGVFQPTYPGGAYAPFVFNLCSFACGDTLPPTLSVTKIIVKNDSCVGYEDYTAHASAPCDSNGATFVWSFPGGTPSSAIGPNVSGILFTAAGTYTATVKYIACSVDSLSQVFTIKSGFHDSLSVINPTNCHQKGTATVYPSGGAPPYTYWWSNGNSNQSDTALGAGSYTCVVSASNGCTDTMRFKITNPISPPFVTHPKRDTGFCVGSKVTLNVSGGSNFLWAPASTLSCTSCTTPIATPTATTTYTVTGIDSIGCPDSAKINVSVDSLPTFSFTSKPEGCGGYTYIIATSSSSFTWLWSPGIGLSDTNLNYTYANPPYQITYTLTASNAFCTFSDTITIAPIPIGFPLKLKATPDTVCQGAIINLLASSTSTVLNWKWLPPTTGLSCLTCPNPSLNTSLITLTSNTYTVALKARDSAGCIAYDTIKLLIIAHKSNAQSVKICKGSSAILSDHSLTTYLWSNGATTSNITVTPTSTTTYYDVVDSLGCVDTNYHTVIIDPGPPITLSTAKDTVCPNSTTPLIALGTQVVTWSWQPGIGLSCYNCHNPVATVSSQITYTVTGTDSSGCTSKDSITLYTISGQSLYQSHLLCKGSSITLTVTDGNSYKWSNGATTTSITVSPVYTATYYAVVSYNGGCFDTIFQTVNVHTPPPIAVSVVPDSICVGGSSQFTAISPKIKTWSWSPSTKLSCINCPNPIASPTATTTYIVSGTDSLGCISSDTIKLKVIPLPVAGIFASHDTVCSGDSVLLIGSGGGSYKWNTTQKTDSIYVNPTTVKTYTLTVTKNGCTDSITKTIHLFPSTSSTVSLSKDSICPNDTTVLSVSGGTSYFWSNGSTATSITVAPNSTISYTVVTKGDCQHDTIIKTVHVVPNPVPLITGKLISCKGKKDTLFGSGGTKYVWSNGSTKTTAIITITKDTTVTLRVYNGKCYGDTSVRITIAPSPTAVVCCPQNVCSGDTVSLTASGGGTYHWSTGSNDSTVIVNPTVSTTYSVFVTNSFGCVTIGTSKVTIDIPPLNSCCDTTILLGNSTVIYAKNTYKYKWYPSTGVPCDTCPENVVSPTVTTTYTIIGTDKQGCDVMQTVTVIVEPPCADYFIPNVFTPNGDNVNDEFEIKVQDATQYSIIIYDRWGKEMYNSSDPTVYWKGTTESGDKAPTGVYYYIISSTCQGKSYKKHGYVHLIR